MMEALGSQDIYIDFGVTLVLKISICFHYFFSEFAPEH